MEKTPRYFVVRRAPKRIEMMDEERTKGCTQDERNDETNFQCRKIKVSLDEKFPNLSNPPIEWFEPFNRDQTSSTRSSNRFGS